MARERTEQSNRMQLESLRVWYYSPGMAADWTWHERYPLLGALLKDTHEIANSVCNIFFAHCTDTPRVAGTRQVSVQILFDLDMNARVGKARDDSGDFVIHISLGVPLMCMWVFSVLAQSAYDILSQPVHTSAFRLSALSRQARLHQEQLRNLAQNQWRSQENETIYTRSEAFLQYVYSRDTEEFWIARSYWWIALHFAVCHELAHITTGQLIAAEMDPSIVRQHREKYGHHAVSHAHEHLCDISACTLTSISAQSGILSTLLKRKAGPSMFRTSAGRFELARSAIGFFWLMLADSSISGVFGGYSDSHPNIWDRWNLLEISRRGIDLSPRQVESAISASIFRCNATIGPPGFFDWTHVCRLDESDIDHERVLDAIESLHAEYAAYRIGLPQIK
jgi:hypothetical protein